VKYTAAAIICFALLICAVGFAGSYDVKILSVDDNGTDTTTRLRGYIEVIDIDMVNAGQTGNVSVVVDPERTTMSDVNIATNPVVTADQTFRPRFDSTSVGGAALTGDPPNRYLVFGDTVKLVVTNSFPTGSVWKAVIKYQKN